jgi:hypothetical protein
VLVDGYGGSGKSTFARAARAVKRGIRRPPGAVLPQGCVDTARWRLRDEWRIAAVACRDRGGQNQRTRALVEERAPHVTLHVLHTRAEAAALLSRV